MSDTNTERVEEADKAESKKKTKKERAPRRHERRFIPQSANNPWLVRVIGALGATTLGAGAWAFAYGHSFDADEKLQPIPSYLIAAGAVLTGATIWLGTSSEAPMRVGDPGIAMERGEVRRMPWWAISQISWEPKSLALLVVGKDEAGSAWSFKVPVKSHGEAASWIMKEALERVPKVVDVADDVVDLLPAAGPHAGTRIELEPLQVVGKKDARTSKTISFEPDARVCIRCERVYMKSSVPKKCKCGASLVHLRGADSDDESESAAEDESSSEDERDSAAASERT